METRMPDGELLRERFETMEQLNARRKVLEAQGGIVERIFTVAERIRTKVSQSKYEPHQGEKEMARRRK
jgi:hypothetical protein